MASSIFERNINYFFSIFLSVLVSVVVVDFIAVSAGLAAPAVVVSAAGAGVAVVVAVVVEVVVESAVLAVSELLLPHDATKRPIESASTLNFTNFMIVFFVCYTR